jgi:DNA-binding MurR/RpiR family transcriptional regulator
MQVPGRVDERIGASRDELTPAEKRVAEVVLADPQAVAFGTVAQVARRAGTSGATVVRLASRLGFRGFADLQSGVQAELARALRPASERIRQPAADDVLSTTLATELDNVHATLAAVDRADFDTAVELLAGPSAGEVEQHLHVLPGDALHGVAMVLATELGMLRLGVNLLAGSDVRVARTLAHVERNDVMVVLDIRRYDRWVLTTAQRAAAAGAAIVAITDSPLSPLAECARVTFAVSAAGAGPFDSHVGTLALVNALVGGVADALRATAATRLDRVERAWSDSEALVDR